MTAVYPNDVDAVLDQCIPEDKTLKEAREYASDMELPDIAVSVQQAKFLELLARTAKAKNVLEIGTLAGYSTIALARAVGEDGYVTTVEYEPRHAKVAHVNLYHAGIHHRTSVLVGDAHDILPKLEPNSFDFIFIDADKESNEAYFKYAYGLGTEDVTVVVDNVIRDGRVLDPSRPDKREFIEFLGRQPAFDVSVIQTTGSKGWDGFVLAKRKVM
ncbi:O-methyltransferase [Mycobacterium phage Papyrus]|uniref:O-methyltransferase n=1 Tax=Mycobacterium phage Papyrus TaxID=1383056 RepID=S5YRC3_9CAUD|nr:methyltransferase [Mycobacterium phage Papyrus]AGT14073.1 O-methyltransferase [Mycobacterium phage Papyrus]